LWSNISRAKPAHDRRDFGVALGEVVQRPLAGPGVVVGDADAESV
jgi:hypothetical protein